MMETLNDNKRLIKLLDKAEKLASEFTGGYSNAFFSAVEFHLALKSSIDKLKQGDLTQFKRLQLWFAPTCSWDDFIGRDGQDLANEIYEILLKIDKT